MNERSLILQTQTVRPDEAEMVEYFGQCKNGRMYFSATDHYVYSFKGLKCTGWICSMAAWNRTFHKIIWVK